MLARLRLSTAAELLYSIPSGKTATVHAIYFANSTTATRKVRLHHCRSNEAAATGNALLYDAAIAPTGTMIDDTRFLMHEGDELRASADASGVTVTLYGTVAP
jgi:hypothetical protein